jgi:hypothetical protein
VPGSRVLDSHLPGKGLNSRHKMRQRALRRREYSAFAFFNVFELLMDIDDKVLDVFLRYAAGGIWSKLTHAQQTQGGIGFRWHGFNIAIW